mgnify:CR=1 FL=1
MAQSGIFNILPTDYQLYLESMLPWMNEVPIGKEYFNKNLQDQLVTEGLTDEFWKTYDNDTRRYLNEQSDLTKLNYEGESRTGWDTIFNTLGTYTSKINPPAAGADPSVTITDRYDWNPDYDEEGYGGKQDVNFPMFGKFLWDTRPRSLGGTGFDFSNTAEMTGNLFGHRQTEGKGRNVNLTIPINNETFNRFASGNFKSNQRNLSNVSSNYNNITGPAGQSASSTGTTHGPAGRGNFYGFNRGGIASIMI